MTRINPISFENNNTNSSSSGAAPTEISTSIWTEKSPEELPEGSEQILKSSVKYKEHKINTDSARGYYVFEKKEDKYILDYHFDINMLQNKTARVFFNGSNITNPDEDGYYRFRGIKDKNHGRFNDKVYMAADKVVSSVEIYNDILRRQKRGEKLNDMEKSFLTDLPKLLDRYGLELDNSGSVRDKQQ